MMSPELYTLFWLLESEHLYVPVDAYNTQIAELTKECKTDVKSDKNVDKVKKTIEVLKQELSSQQKEKEKLDQFLESKKEIIVQNFFNLECNLPFLQYCCLPRLRLSPSDAIFSVKFINTMIALKGQPFLDQLEFKFNTVKLLYPTVLACSEVEAFDLGVFCEELLEITKNLNDNVRLYADAKGGKKFDKSNIGEVHKIRYAILLLYKSLTEVFETTFRDSTFMQVNIVKT